MKKILLIIVSVLLVGALAFCIGWAIKNKDKIVEIANGANLYTEKDVEEAYNKGKEDTSQALKDYEKQISELKGKIEAQKIEYNRLQQDYDKLQEDDAKIIEDLNKQIEDLKKSLKEYKDLLESIENENYYVVTFDIDGLSTPQIVLKNNYAEVPNAPTKQGYAFMGWMLDNEIVDVATYQITQNTTFVAKFEKSYEVIFKADNKIVSSQTLISGQEIQIPSEPTKTYYTFKGWSLNGEDIIDNSEITTATNDIEYYAVFENEHYVIYTFSDGSKSYDYTNEVEYICTEMTINNSIVELELPSCVQYLKENATTYLQSLRKITLPKSIIKIEYSFVSSTEISEVNILNENITIESCIFLRIRNDVTINFAGTTSQWAENCPNSYSGLVSVLFDSKGTITINCSDGILTYTK